MRKVYIVSAKRTPVGSFMGSLAGIAPGKLGAIAIKAALEGHNVPLEELYEVTFGNVLMAGHAQGIARQASVHAGIPHSVPAYGVNMICGSGLKSVMNAYVDIVSGQAEMVVAGGVESMSQAGFVLPASVRAGFKMGDLKMKDHMVVDGLTDAFNNYHMGITAENIADRFKITRQEQDEFAFASQQKAIKAVDSGRFDDEIVAVDIQVKKETVKFAKDEYPNRSTSVEKLGGLRPAFKPEGGTVTAGNASGLNDGAAAFLVVSEDAVKKYNLKPLAEIVGIGQGGCDPSTMGLGPAPATLSALKHANLKIEDINLFEYNEAFAAQALGAIRLIAEHTGYAADKILAKSNPNGGAIAIGHPIGASGARIATTLVHEMGKQGVQYGLASLCIGGGMGVAMILKKA
ncbi:MAG: acetyl-CoA C-acetyltransferase [Brevinema sp.]